MDKNKVLLINLPPSISYSYTNRGSIYPATGILVVGTILKNRGFKVQVIDGTIYVDYKERVLNAIDNSTILIGFSVMTSQVSMALKLSKVIRTKYSDIPIVWGGIHPILFPEQTIRNSNIDIVVTGEGAKTVSDICDYLKGQISLDKVKGIGFKDTSGRIILTEQSEPDDLNDLPHVDYTIFDDLELYLNTVSVYRREISVDNKSHIRFMPILTGLGCCFKCQFCINVILKRKYRFRSAQSIIDEIKRLQNKYAVDAFLFLDEDFFISKRRLLEFLDLIEKENLKFYWRIWGRVDYFRDNYLNKNLINRLEKCGLRSIAMGAESGSQKVLNLIQKGIKVQNILHSATMLKGTKITPRYSFMVGLEGEDKEDTKATYKLCADLIEVNQRVDIAGPFIFRYYPGSPIFDRIIEKYRIRIPDEIEEWGNALHKEGFLKFDNMPWIWNGCIETSEMLNKGIFMWNKLRNSKKHKVLLSLIKKIIIWRLKYFNTSFIELHAYILYKKIRYYRK